MVCYAQPLPLMWLMVGLIWYVTVRLMPFLQKKTHTNKHTMHAYTEVGNGWCLFLRAYLLHCGDCCWFCTIYCGVREPVCYSRNISLRCVFTALYTLSPEFWSDAHVHNQRQPPVLCCAACRVTQTLSWGGVVDAAENALVTRSECGAPLGTYVQRQTENT